MIEHSDRAMQAQDAFNELARIRLKDHSVESVMDIVALLAKQTIPGAHEVSVTLVDSGDAKTVAFTGALANSLDERQYAHDHGPCLDCIAGGEPVLISSMSADKRWHDWSADALAQGVHSSLSIPCPLQREVAAALNIYGIQEQAFDQASIELAHTFAAYAAVALANMQLYEAQGQVVEQLRTAMHSRAVIEQAKGILMAERRCSADDAFNLLVQLSQDTNRKLREVAQALVSRADGSGTTSS